MAWKWFKFLRAATASAPTASALGVGAPFYDTTLNQLKISDGTNWKTISQYDSSGFLSGNGLVFPATQVPSADANTLDDYEEGTWDATLTPGTSGTITLYSSYNKCSYTKVGNRYFVSGGIQITSVSSPVGTTVRLSLPATIAAPGERSGRLGGAVTYQDASPSAQSAKPFEGIESTAYISIYMDASTLATSDEFSFSFSFIGA